MIQHWVFPYRLYVDLTVVHMCLGSVADVAKFIGLELLQLAGAFLVYPLFQVGLMHCHWCHERCKLCCCLPPLQTWTSMRKRCWSVFFILLYCFYVIGSWFGVVSVIWTLSFPPFLRVLSTIEQVVWCDMLWHTTVIGSYKPLSPSDEALHEKLLLHPWECIQGHTSME